MFYFLKDNIQYRQLSVKNTINLKLVHIFKLNLRRYFYEQFSCNVCSDILVFRWMHQMVLYFFQVFNLKTSDHFLWKVHWIECFVADSVKFRLYYEKCCFSESLTDTNDQVVDYLQWTVLKCIEMFFIQKWCYYFINSATKKNLYSSSTSLPCIMIQSQ